MESPPTKESAQTVVHSVQADPNHTQQLPATQNASAFQYSRPRPLPQAEHADLGIVDFGSEVGS